MISKIAVVGAGLSGCECALKLADLGYTVDLYEMKPAKLSDAHHEKELLSELVCSNSFKSYKQDNANGLLKFEMEKLGSHFIEASKNARIVGSDDLIVDRNIFSTFLTKKIYSNSRINFISEELKEIPDNYDVVVIATGPLTTGSLMKSITSLIGEQSLSFFDAASPLIFASSLDHSKMIKKSKYTEESEDSNYLNIFLSSDAYYSFVDKLLISEKVVDHVNSHFESCLPIEEIARRGKDSLRFGPMSPRGITDDKNVFAVVQLRQDDVAKSLYNLVGFQTNLTFKAQKDLIQSLPGMEKCSFARYGLMHRNSYVNAPKVLNRNLSLKTKSNVFIVGQLSGVEGYVESAAMGLLGAYYVVNYLNKDMDNYAPIDTMVGSLVNYLVMSNPKHFAPMNSTYGILYYENKKDRMKAFENSINKLDCWLNNFYKLNKIK